MGDPETTMKMALIHEFSTIVANRPVSVAVMLQTNFRVRSNHESRREFCGEA